MTYGIYFTTFGKRTYREVRIDRSFATLQMAINVIKQTYPEAKDFNCVSKMYN